MNNGFTQKSISEKEQAENQLRYEQGEIAKLSTDDMYLLGVKVQFRDDKKYEYSNKFESANQEWLNNSVKERVESKLSARYPTKAETNKNSPTYHFTAYDKDFRNFFGKYHSNPELIKLASPEQQASYLAGVMDSRATIPATELRGDGILIPFSNNNEAFTVKDLFQNFDVEANVHSQSGFGTRLSVKGEKNYRNILNSIPMENKEKASSLEKMINEGEKTKARDRQYRENYELGNRWENALGEYLGIRFPNSEIQKGQRLRPNDKHSEIPDYLVTHPDGTREIYDAKLRSSNTKTKDRDYTKEADRVIICFVIDERSNKGKEKPYELRSIDSLIKDLDFLKNQTTKQQEKDRIQKLSNELQQIKEEAQKLPPTKRSSSGKSRSNSEGKGEPSNDNTGDGGPPKEEDEGDGGREEQQYKEPIYEQGDQIAGGKEGSKKLQK